MNAESNKLVRAIGRWTLTALVINAIIGSGIFGLPSDIARLLGASAPLAYLAAAAGMGIIMACFAEVASQFREAGGPYLYAREIFGRFIGIEVGWLAFLVRLASAAANANLFVISLGLFLPSATEKWPRIVLLTLVLGLLGFINLRGVRSGAQLSNFFTVVKILPLLLFVAAGMGFTAGRFPVGMAEASANDWFLATLALVFALGGFESSLMPMAEVKDPRRDAPFALFVALLVCATLYTLIHLVVMAVVPVAQMTERPLADAARVMFGPAGATLMAAAAMLSTYGYLSGQMLSAPRMPYAMAEQGDFPPQLARVHPRFRTPYVSIIVYTALALALAIYGSFFWNAILSAVARLFVYAPVAAGVMVLRRRAPQADAYRLPAGWLFSVLGMFFCAVLVLRMERHHLYVLLAITAVSLVNWLWVRRTR
jgi:APA family basic amino acid/polyamine antiporter